MWSKKRQRYVFRKRSRRGRIFWLLVGTLMLVGLFWFIPWQTLSSVEIQDTLKSVASKDQPEQAPVEDQPEQDIAEDQPEQADTQDQPGQDSTSDLSKGAQVINQETKQPWKGLLLRKKERRMLRCPLLLLRPSYHLLRLLLPLRWNRFHGTFYLQTTTGTLSLNQTITGTLERATGTMRTTTTGITNPPTAQSWDVIEGPDGRVSHLLSLDKVCRALSMGKS